MAIRSAWGTCAVAMFAVWMGCGNEGAERVGWWGTSGGDDDRCKIVGSTPVAWTETSSMGTPEAAFRHMAGTCEALLVWDGAGWGGTLVVTPQKGESIVTVSLVIDQASARLVDRTPTGSGGAPYCPTTLEVEAEVTLETPEGWLARQQPVTLQASNESRCDFTDFVLSSEEFGNWVSVTPADAKAKVSMGIQLMPVSDACVGTVALNYELTLGQGTEYRGQPTFASWSDTGCATGEFGVNLAEPYQGVDLLAAVAAAFDRRTIDATWEDDGVTTFSLGTSVTALDVCAEAMSYGDVLIIPVEIVANTSDGRVNGFTGQGTVRAKVSDESLNQLQLWVSKELSCSSTDDVLPYTTVACAEVQGITMQLGINNYSNATGQDEGKLEIYVFDRDSAASPGAAGRVDRLELNF